MELRVLKYFLAVAREQNISNAAEVLHLTQPTLSRQLKELEDELGKKLLIRGNRKITLTEEGLLLKKRAEEIVSLSDKTIDELKQKDDNLIGDIYIGSGELYSIKWVLKGINKFQNKYPNINFHIISGDRDDHIDKLENGLIDFGIFLNEIDKSKYNYLELPVSERWGVLVRKDSKLANLKEIQKKDINNMPLIITRQGIESRVLADFVQDAKIVGTYNLVYNASLMVEEGLGVALCLDNIINTSGNSNLCFIPLKIDFKFEMNIMWKKYQVFSKASNKFISELENELKKYPEV